MTANPEWNEADSRLYREIASVAVPRREEQVAALLVLVPFGREEAFSILELGCGEGLLGAALLEALPQARYVGLDGSQSMQREPGARLQRFGGRARVAGFALEATDWLPRTGEVDVVVSSLCVHHLSGDGKRRLFAALFGRLSSRGALLLADLVEPARAEARELFAASWDRTVLEQALARGGGEALRRRFDEERWNYYRYPDPRDRPSPLFDQLLWLREAGFVDVDCFWLHAGHAVYGGYMPAGTR